VVRKVKILAPPEPRPATPIKLDGVSVIKALRARPKTAKVPIITLAASVGERQHATVLAAGGDLALDKPCLRDELEKVVRASISRGRHGRESRKGQG
jgi:DNA-binding response OmpR family regulator